MRTTLTKIVGLILIPFFCVGQAKINEIDKAIQVVKSELRFLKKIERANSKDGTSYVFLQDNELKLITIKAIEPTTEKNVEWYFIDGELAYCETNWFDLNSMNTIFNEKCYLNKGHLILWTNSRDNSIDSASDEFKKMEVNLVAYGVKIKENALK